MNKLYLAVSVYVVGFLGLTGLAGATVPIVDPEAEITSLFETHAPTVVAVILAIAGFTITMSVLSSGIRKIRQALGRG